MLVGFKYVTQKRAWVHEQCGTEFPIPASGPYEVKQPMHDHARDCVATTEEDDR